MKTQLYDIKTSKEHISKVISKGKCAVGWKPKTLKEFDLVIISKRRNDQAKGKKTTKCHGIITKIRPAKPGEVTKDFGVPKKEGVWKWYIHFKTIKDFPNGFDPRDHIDTSRYDPQPLPCYSDAHSKVVLKAIYHSKALLKV